MLVGGTDPIRSTNAPAVDAGLLAVVAHEHGGGFGLVAEGRDGGDDVLLFASGVGAQRSGGRGRWGVAGLRALYPARRGRLQRHVGVSLVLGDTCRVVGAGGIHGGLVASRARCGEFAVVPQAARSLKLRIA